MRPAAARWLRDVDQLGQDLKGQKLEQLAWQKKVEELFPQVPLADVLKLIDFDRLTANVKFVDNGALSLRFKFPEVEGVPKNLVFGKQIFALKKDRSVVPHGHNNMATAFLILKGDLHGRHYDRLKDEPEHYHHQARRSTAHSRRASARPCRTTRTTSTGSRPITEPAFIFNLHVMEVNPDNASRPAGCTSTPRAKSSPAA